LALPEKTATATSGSKKVQWTATVEHQLHTTEAWTMLWRAKVNDVVQGSGSFEVYVGSNVGEIVLDVTLLAGDIVVIDFSSVSF
jgi:hypothetical protein